MAEFLNNQDSQCTHNETLRRVCVATVALKKQ